MSNTPGSQNTSHAVARCWRATAGVFCLRARPHHPGGGGANRGPRKPPPPPLPPPPHPVARPQPQAASPCTDRPPRFGPLRSARRRPGAPRGPPFHHHGGHGRVRGTSRSAWRQRGGSSVVRLPLTHRQANPVAAGRLDSFGITGVRVARHAEAGVVGEHAPAPPPPRPRPLGHAPLPPAQPASGAHAAAGN